MTVILVSWMACVPDPHGGTFVGNPGDASARASRVDERIELDRVEIPVATLDVVDCDGVERSFDVGRTLDGLGGDEPIDVPGGRYCTLALGLDGPVVASGVTDGGTTFVVDLDLGRIVSDGRVDVDGQHLLFEVPLLLEPDVIEALGADVTIPADDPSAVAWAEASVVGTSLWEDADADGLLSASDVRLAFGDTGLPPSALSGADAGCGCGSTRGGGWCVVLIGLLVVRRARRRL